MQVFFMFFVLFMPTMLFLQFISFIRSLQFIMSMLLVSMTLFYDTIIDRQFIIIGAFSMKNKKRTLISCAMLADEVNHILKTTDTDLPVIWVERGLHSTPDKLNRILQHYIDALQDQDEILLTFGLCGNGTSGLVSPGTILRLPKFDDCINLLLCKQPRTQRKQTETDAIYLTRGWTLDKEAILQQYQILSRQYDTDMRDLILQTMYGGYHTLSVIDTGCFDLKPVERYADQAASCLHFDRNCVPGNLTMLKHLITGCEDSDIITLAPGKPVVQSLFEI